jgi:hypothetical protein
MSLESWTTSARSLAFSSSSDSVPVLTSASQPSSSWMDDEATSCPASPDIKYALPITDTPWHELTPAKPSGQDWLSPSQNWDDSAGKPQHGCSDLLTLPHLACTVLTRAAAQTSCFHFDQRDHPQSPRFPWLGTCADETKRSKNSDYSTVGSVDSNAADRSGRSHRKRLAEILPRTSGHTVAAIGFPVPRTGQMADHPRLVAGSRAIVRPLDISRAAYRPGPQAATGPSQAQGQELWRRDRVTAGAMMVTGLSPRPPARAPKTSVRRRSRSREPTSPTGVRAR